MKYYDLIIIGGGAAGIMAAISAKRKNSNLTVAILDRTFALGRKILVCGAGRCNITNINLDKSIDQHYYGALSDFTKNIFDQFGFRDIESFFLDLGIPLYIERKTNIGKLFPITDQAKTVTALLEDELDRLNIDVWLNTEVLSVKKVDEKFQIAAKKLDEESQKDLNFNSTKLILSAGGKTYPALGSNGSGYDIAKALGHKMIHPVPSALPLVSKNPLSHELQGQKFEMEVTSLIDGKVIKTRTDDVMFTQYGLSGPAILNISREISIHINRESKNNASVRLNFLPGLNPASAMELFHARWSRRPDQSLEVSMYGLFPNKFPGSFLRVLKIDHKKIVNSLTDQEKQLIVNSLTSFEVKITDTRGWNEAEFTAGGVDTSELKPKTLESEKVPNLYFCGEILDVDGDVGGFNLSWAWSSGHVAGMLN